MDTNAFTTADPLMSVRGLSKFYGTRIGCDASKLRWRHQIWRHFDDQWKLGAITGRINEAC